MKSFLFRTILFFIGVIAIFICFDTYSNIPNYSVELAKDNSMIKLKGTELLEKAPENNIILLGASELNTFMIPTHPSNFFTDDNPFAVNIVGRGSCQSIIHASILASSQNMDKHKVSVIISPQAFVPQGIAPDMYFANFSTLQFINIQLDNTLSTSIKSRFSQRFLDIYERYTKEHGNLPQFDTDLTIANITVNQDLKSKLLWSIIKPYAYLKLNILNAQDKYRAKKQYLNPVLHNTDYPDITSSSDSTKINEKLLEVAKVETDNNDFGFLNDYYNVNVGRKLDQFEDKDSELSYSNSVEYEDLTLLLDVCREKGIKPLFINTPLHGEWSDYTGFSKQERDQYYKNVLDLLASYNSKVCDFSNSEYEPYFLSDVMHFGWIGWYEINENLSKFYYENTQ